MFIFSLSPMFQTWPENDLPPFLLLEFNYSFIIQKTEPSQKKKFFCGKLR